MSTCKRIEEGGNEQQDVFVTHLRQQREPARGGSEARPRRLLVVRGAVERDREKQIGCDRQERTRNGDRVSCGEQQVQRMRQQQNGGNRREQRQCRRQVAAQRVRQRHREGGRQAIEENCMLQIARG